MLTVLTLCVITAVSRLRMCYNVKANRQESKVFSCENIAPPTVRCTISCASSSPPCQGLHVLFLLSSQLELLQTARQNTIAQGIKVNGSGVSGKVLKRGKSTQSAFVEQCIKWHELRGIA